ncbi:DNA-binding transcriptional MerR regulator [Haloactinopolyspora alba]|uniref:DNA-binding transcriptional MerR regulator n=1 Tax=Haloactinopolyspora alba TaxID=648780 RepID=A0A2P8E7A6_9ACTN|nr:heavy metal-responsive transcriptional regulator [Haloactinopolyspora alba]PSL05346.1 DNA-binding transcriptional MerR regulator [Haloactinopolyspora alba]
MALELREKAHNTTLTVSALASEVGVSADAVRYYERAGLLPAPPRSPSGYRLYDRRAVDRLRFIQGCQRLGLRLREIADLLSVRDTGECPCEPAEHLLSRRVSEIDAEIERLTSLRSEMVTMLAHPADADCPDPVPGTWCAEGGESCA